MDNGAWRLYRPVLTVFSLATVPHSSMARDKKMCERLGGTREACVAKKAIVREKRTSLDSSLLASAHELDTARADETLTGDACLVSSGAVVALAGLQSNRSRKATLRYAVSRFSRSGRFRSMSELVIRRSVSPPVLKENGDPVVAECASQKRVARLAEIGNGVGSHFVSPNGDFHRFSSLAR